jgi:hypothetical protein
MEALPLEGPAVDGKDRTTAEGAKANTAGSVIGDFELHHEQRSPGEVIDHQVL